MPTIFSHAVAGAALAHAIGPKRAKIVAVAGASAMLPDADALLHFAGVPYASAFGHRGFTHSIAFAALWATLLTYFWFRSENQRLWIGLVFFAATLSHPLLDMFTSGGLGCALLSPFSFDRLFFPWRPIAVAPIGTHGLLGPRGITLLQSELRWVWLPSLVVVGASWLARRR